MCDPVYYPATWFILNILNNGCCFASSLIILAQDSPSATVQQKAIFYVQRKRDIDKQIERERERERDRETERQRDRQTGRQTDRQTEEQRQIDGDGDRETEKERTRSRKR